MTEALRLNPGYDEAHNNLGNLLYTQRKYEEAEAHFAEALRLRPTTPKRTTTWAWSCPASGTTRRQGLSSPRPYGSNPVTPKAYNASAMIMAACPEAKFRDGKGAVEFATRACELTEWKNPDHS